MPLPLVAALLLAIGADQWEVVNQQIVTTHNLDTGFVNAGRTDSAEACRDLCAANATCVSFDWYGHAIPFKNKTKPCNRDSTCLLSFGGIWDPHANGYCNHTSGRDTTRSPPPTPAPPAPGKCQKTVCHSDTDCSSLRDGCTWCRDDVPGAGHDMVCGGPPGPGDCGTLPGPAANSSRTQYASFGDSVSKGIFGPLAKLASAGARAWESFHPSANEGGGCGNTMRGLDCTDPWLDGANRSAADPARQWDVLTFNYGLHDLAQDGERVGVQQYAANLRNLTVRMLQAPWRSGAPPKLFWVTSTPVPDAHLSPPRKQSDVPVYNAAAQTVMSALGVPTIDLFSFVLSKCGGVNNYTSCDGFQLPHNVHFTAAGWQAMAAFQWEAIRNAA